MIRRRNSDADLRALKRSCLDDRGDIIAYERYLAARLRAGLPLEDPEISPFDVDAHAILLRFRVASGITTRSRISMADRLGHEAARIVNEGSTGWAGLGGWDFRSRIICIGQLVDRRNITSFACDCAERVIDHFERGYPNDQRPRRAIESARLWITVPSESNRRSAYSRSEDVRNAEYGRLGYYTYHYSAMAAAAAARTAAAFSASEAVVNAATGARDASSSELDNRTEISIWQQFRLAEYLVGDAVIPNVTIDY